MKSRFLEITFLCLLVASFASCNNKKQKEYTEAQTLQPTVAAIEGKKLMEQKCNLCHSPSSKRTGRIAPPMVAVKSHYLDENTTKEEFVNAIWNFVEKPTKAKSKMNGAVFNFGLMPYQSFEEAEIKKIASYIYEYKIEEPTWFKDHLEEESKGKMKYRNDGKSSASLNASETLTPSEIGMKYALSTKKELGKNLMGTIQSKGTLEAVTFCNKQAYPITDSMATAQNAKIKRVSDQPRNPENQANAKENKYIQDFKTTIAAGKEVNPVVEHTNGMINFYYPITTNTMCLQCHGNSKSQIDPLVLSTIKNLYPEDKALEYDVNQVRGIWAITFDDNSIN